jgi:hypothetical protein
MSFWPLYLSKTAQPQVETVSEPAPRLSHLGHMVLVSSTSESSSILLDVKIVVGGTGNTLRICSDFS